jgi:hypothetical protein
MSVSKGARWLLLIHQIPPKPAYLRVKIGRRLAKLGAVAIKNSVYALQNTDATAEHFQWVLREIVEGGGDATICEAGFVRGISDADVEKLFVKARDAEYAELAGELRALLKSFPRGAARDERRTKLEADLGRARRRLEEIVALDFFGSAERSGVESVLATAEARLLGPPEARGTRAIGAGEYRGRTWVTRKGIHVDRMASAWLIRRFIDPDATFKFVAAKGYEPIKGELRFDMYDGEFTHEGDLCTFEVLVQRMQLSDPGLRLIAEVVHDIDLRDEKFGRAETAGIARLIAGIALGHRDDEARLARASAVFDDLFESHPRRRS